jgi:hypothetical protein
LPVSGGHSLPSRMPVNVMDLYAVAKGGPVGKVIKLRG